tara:strand:- start:437 stop:949 length:513 start_codon:yes stop_codon:yes gene_type:complete
MTKEISTSLVSLFKKHFSSRIYELAICIIVLSIPVAGLLLYIHYPSHIMGSQWLDQRESSNFTLLMNDLCADVDYNINAVLSGNSDHVEQVQGVYAFLLDLHRNDEDILKKLLDFRNYITDREWIDRFVWVEVSRNSKIYFFSSLRNARTDELEKQADALIRELNPRAGL